MQAVLGSRDTVLNKTDKLLTLRVNSNGETMTS